MKGGMMKAGQMVSFTMETLPEEAQQSLSSLSADAPPMPTGLASEVVARGFRAPPEKLVLEWARLSPTLDAVIVQRGPEALVHPVETVGFLVPNHGLRAQQIVDYVSLPYVRYLTDACT